MLVFPSNCVVVPSSFVLLPMPNLLPELLLVAKLPIFPILPVVLFRPRPSRYPPGHLEDTASSRAYREVSEQWKVDQVTLEDHKLVQERTLCSRYYAEAHFSLDASRPPVLFRLPPRCLPATFSYSATTTDAAPDVASDHRYSRRSSRGVSPCRAIGEPRSGTET